MGKLVVRVLGVGRNLTMVSKSTERSQVDCITFLHAYRVPALLLPRDDFRVDHGGESQAHDVYRESR